MIEIIVSIIGFVGCIVAAVLSSRATRDAVTQKLEVNQAVTSNEIEHIKKDMQEMKSDIKEHNSYAKLFSETVPVIKEQIKVINHRIQDLEQGGKKK